MFMKKMKTCLLLFFIVIICPFRVDALAGDIHLNCKSVDVFPGDIVTCSIVGKGFVEEVSSFHAEIVLGNHLSLKETHVYDSWEGSASNGIIDLYTDVNKSGQINLVNFSVVIDNISQNAITNIKLTDIIVGDGSFNEYEFDDVIYNLNILANNGNYDSGNSGNDEDIEIGNDSVTGDASDKNSNKNPSTGSFSPIVILVILLGSLLLIFKYKKIVDLWEEE